MKSAFNFILVAVMLISCANLHACGDSAIARKPNVVIILADDLGYGDLGCYGAEDIRTPNLDRMAREGTRFTDFCVVAPLCTPSRVALMTGQYPGRLKLATGVLRPDAKNGVPKLVITLGDLAHEAGYETGYIGKWHLGFVNGMRPLDQGFNSYFGVLHNLDRVETKHFDTAGGMPILRGDDIVARPADPAKMTSLYTEEALQFIDRNRERPFFLFVAHAMPHLPFDASPPFKGQSRRGLYGDVIEELDASTGRILDRIRALGLAENTVVLFSSDNGPERRTPGSAGVLRGTKHTVYEGGVRVPCIAWWPKKIPSDRTCTDFITALDVWPTIARFCGSEIAKPMFLDGRDQSEVFYGNSKVANANKSDLSDQTQMLYILYGLNQNRLEAVRAGPWKLHLTDPVQLYNLDQDLGESRSIADQHPEIVRQLTLHAEKIRALPPGS